MMTMNERPATPATRTAPVGEYCETGGRRLWLHTSASGGPSVVFVPAASNVGLDYLNIHDQIGGFATSVLYDRAGTGWSDPAPLPRTAAEVAGELRELLRAANIPGPYMLVAHSLGGAYARRFGQLFPADVAGLVTLDAFHEDWDEYMAPRLHLGQAKQPDPGPLQYKLIRPVIARMYRKMLASWPDGIREPLIDAHLDYAWFKVGVAERSSMVQLRDELQGGGSVPDVPVIALTTLAADQGQSLLLSRQALAELNEGKLRLDKALVSAATAGEQRILPDARHSTIQIDRPDAVVAAIRDVLGRSSR
jgi:pimeloyl-ACP methyl ester carboxylesterase